MFGPGQHPWHGPAAHEKVATREVAYVAIPENEMGFSTSATKARTATAALEHGMQACVQMPFELYLSAEQVRYYY